ncbi:MAG: nucleotidyltransferase domain-containing protein [Oscillospiraceae bacterium]|nr:nucleotidyltransferase domain-containing protein [Oscillospiraceae bacterium]
MKPYETPEIQEKLRIIKEGVLSVVPDTEAIYLFGSYAYGVPHKDSDLDICVIVPDSVEARELDLEVEIGGSYSRKLHFPTDLLVKKASVFDYRRQATTLDKTIANKGVRFYEHT